MLRPENWWTFDIARDASQPKNVMGTHFDQRHMPDISHLFGVRTSFIKGLWDFNLYTLYNWCQLWCRGQCRVFLSIARHGQQSPNSHLARQINRIEFSHLGYVSAHLNERQIQTSESVSVWSRTCQPILAAPVEWYSPQWQVLFLQSLWVT